ncbi:MAG: hypothetical protein ABIX28_16645 [Vicinamibacterales bacterium]
MRAAVQPLIDHRRAQVDVGPFKIFEGPTGRRPDESALGWIERMGASMQPVNPANGIPYSVLLVGTPADIPFEFQYHLDIYWAVGRIWFETPEEYGRYAATGIGCEGQAALSAKRVAIFAPAHEGDQATRAFSEYVATPLSV